MSAICPTIMENIHLRISAFWSLASVLRLARSSRVDSVASTVWMLLTSAFTLTKSSNRQTACLASSCVSDRVKISGNVSVLVFMAQIFWISKCTKKPKGKQTPFIAQQAKHSFLVQDNMAQIVAKNNRSFSWSSVPSVGFAFFSLKSADVVLPLWRFSNLPYFGQEATKVCQVCFCRVLVLSWKSGISPKFYRMRSKSAKSYIS